MDASGKRTECPGWLDAKGARIRFDRFPSNYLYVCRHYQLDDPLSTPPRHGTGANFDYFGYSTFYGERGHYAITLAARPTRRTLRARCERPKASMPSARSSRCSWSG